MRHIDEKILEAVRKKLDIDAIARSLGKSLDKKEVGERIIYLGKRGYITGYPRELRLSRKGYDALFSGTRVAGLGDKVKVKVKARVQEKHAIRERSAPPRPGHEPRTRKAPSLPAFELPDFTGKLGGIKKSFSIQGIYSGKAWRPLLMAADGILVLLFLLILFNKSNFTNIEYFTALTVLLGSAVFAGLAFRSTEEGRCFTMGYLSALMLISTALVITIKLKGYSTTAMVPFLLGAAVVASQVMRFGKFVYTENLWIAAASYAGFWIVLGKFSGLGVLGLVLAINTALLIGFLSRTLLKDEEDEEDV